MNWELIFKFIGLLISSGLLAVLLRHLVVSAPVTFQARRNDAATLISDLQRRVATLEEQMKINTRALAHSSRERDALFVHHDVARDKLLLAADMHEKCEQPGAALIREWKSVPSSKAVIESVPRDADTSKNDENNAAAST